MTPRTVGRLGTALCLLGMVGCKTPATTPRATLAAEPSRPLTKVVYGQIELQPKVSLAFVLDVSGPRGYQLQGVSLQSVQVILTGPDGDLPPRTVNRADFVDGKATFAFSNLPAGHYGYRFMGFSAVDAGGALVTDNSGSVELAAGERVTVPVVCNAANGQLTFVVCGDLCHASPSPGPSPTPTLAPSISPDTRTNIVLNPGFDGSEDRVSPTAYGADGTNDGHMRLVFNLGPNLHVTSIEVSKGDVAWNSGTDGNLPTRHYLAALDGGVLLNPTQQEFDASAIASGPSQTSHTIDIYASSDAQAPFTLGERFNYRLYLSDGSYCETNDTLQGGMW